MRWWICRLRGCGAPKVDPRALFAQLRDRLVEELDYFHEADVQQAFAVRFRERRGLPHTRGSGGRRPGARHRMGRGDPPHRSHHERRRRSTNGATIRLLRFLLSSPARVGLIHGDPHPGNFRMLPDGRLVVLDFGSSEPMPRGWPSQLGEFLRAGRDGDASRLHEVTVATGMLVPTDSDSGNACRNIGSMVRAASSRTLSLRTVLAAATSAPIIQPPQPRRSTPAQGPHPGRVTSSYSAWPSGCSES